MEVVHRQCEVALNAEKLFDLVNDTPQYPRFIPYCTKGLVLAESASERLAELTFGFMGVEYTLRTRNQLLRPERIDVTLVEGPLDHLQGHWSFESMGESRSRVQAHFEFAFTSALLASLFTPLLRQVLETLLQRLCDHALKTL